MAETKLDIGGSTEEAQRAIDKLTKRMAGLTEQMRVMKEQSKQHTKEAVSGQQQLASTLAGTIAKVTTLGAIAREAHSGWLNRLNEIKQRYDELLPKLTKPLGEAAQLERAPEVKKFLGNLQKQGITREQGMAALEGAMQAGELAPDKQQQIAGEAAKFGGIGVDPKALAGMMSEIAKVAPEMTPGDVADSAMGMKRMLGSKAQEAMSSDAWQKQLGRLKESGMSSTEAMNLAINAMARDEKGMALDLIGKKLGHEKMSRDERQELAKLTKPEDIADIREKMEGFRKTDFGAQQLAAATPEQRRMQALAAEKDITTSQIGPSQSTLADVQQARLEATSRRNDFSSNMQTSLNRVMTSIDSLSRFLGLETAEGQAKSLAAAGVRAGQFSQGRADDLLAELKTQTAIMQRDERKPERRNVDGHTE